MERHVWRELVPMDRYRVCTSGLLHEHDRKVLTMLYQPLIGNMAVALYMTLWSEQEQNEEEYTHHSLVVHTCMKLPDLYKERRKLEAIGLLKVYVKKEEDMRSFLYELQPPLSPKQFFHDIVLNIFLFNRLGKTKYNRLKQQFLKPEHDRSSYENITHSFSDVFEPVLPSQIAQLKQEVEMPEQFTMNMYSDGAVPGIRTDFFDFDLFVDGLSPLIPKKAITEPVRECVIKLAYVYGIPPLAMQHIVLGAITDQNAIDMETLRKSARDWYQFEHGNALPVFCERTQPYEARTMSDKEPANQEELFVKELEQLSPRELLKEISGGIEPTSADLKIIEDVMIHQKLLPGVVNVLIHYVMLRTDMKLSKAYIERIAGHWARKNIRTVTEAMAIAKAEHRQYQQWADSKKKGKRTTRKELVPDWVEEQKKPHVQAEQTDIEEKRRKLEEALKQYKKE